MINQDIFDEKFHKKIFQFQLKDSAIGSMASGHCEEIVSIKEFINIIVSNAEKILKKWGYQGNEFSTLGE